MILLAGLSLLGASCSYGQKAWQGTGAPGTGTSQTSPAISPTTGPTETLDQIDEDTTKLGTDIDAQMKQNEGDVQGASKEAQNY